MLDLRIPSGWFFAIVGIILLLFGVFVPDARSAMVDANVDLYCGVAMLVFGGFLLALAFRASRHSS